MTPDSGRARRDVDALAGRVRREIVGHAADERGELLQLLRRPAGQGLQHLLAPRLADPADRVPARRREPDGVRAPVAVWRKFLSEDPPPLFHDFFAMLMRVPDFVLEGDSLIAMQNARALHRMMNIMRETGAPNA